MANVMIVEDFVETVQLLPPKDSVLVRGDHGIGKSQVIRQVAEKIAESDGLELIVFDAKDVIKLVKERGEDVLGELADEGKVIFIDCRLGQMSDGDVIGMPEGSNGITWFNPPVWFRLACDVPCIVFLDEINRATLEVMQAAFQIVLDHQMAGYHLHSYTRVYAAINDAARYSVNDMDPALQDRFWTIDLRPTRKDWMRWARSSNAKKPCGFNVLPVIASFIEADHIGKWLDPEQNTLNEVTTSRRSWEKLSDAYEHARVFDPSKKVYFNIAKGYVGVSAATAFVDFAKTQQKQVTGEEVIRRYTTDPTVKTRISQMGVENLNVMIDRVCGYIMSLNASRLTAEQGKNLAAFLEDLPSKELQVACWSILTKDGAVSATMVKSVHKYVHKYVLAVYGTDENDILDNSRVKKSRFAAA